MLSKVFYRFALIALVATGFFVIQTASGSANTAYHVGSGIFAFLASFAVVVGSAFRVVDQRLQKVERE